MNVDGKGNNLRATQVEELPKVGVAEKIVSLDDLARLVRAEQEQGREIAHCHGVFDLMHLGHLRHLQQAKHVADRLVVTITPDRFVNKGPGRPVFNEFLRAESLAALEFVDWVAINDSPTAIETIRTLKPDIYVKGSDYQNSDDDLTGKIVEERKAVEENGGRIHFTDDITFSSSNLINRHFQVLPPESDAFLTEFRKRWTSNEIIEALDQLRAMKVLVIGDTIIDEYIFCQPLGMASKSTTINARYIEAESHAGGVLAVANHVAGFCDNVELVTLLGEVESQEEFIRSKLKSNVQPTFLMRPNGPTTRKRRFLHKYLYQKMFEMTIIEDSVLPPQVQARLNAHLAERLTEADLVIVTDFGHGLISDSTVDVLSRKAKFIALSAQMNSANLGFNSITRYPRADYLCIDQEEMRHAYHDRFGPLNDLIRRAAEHLDASYVTVTRGHQGSSTYMTGNGIHETPVFSDRAVDAIGAGDAFLSITSPMAAQRLPAEVISFVGNAVGALAIQYLGNRDSIESAALKKFIVTLLK